MITTYKATSIRGMSHYDWKTMWIPGEIVELATVAPASEGPCGVGLHCSPTLLDAVGYQPGPSRYFECNVADEDIVARDTTKFRCKRIFVVKELFQDEMDALAGMNLYEANHPINPFRIDPAYEGDAPFLMYLLQDWIAIIASIPAGVMVWDVIAAALPIQARDAITHLLHAEVGAAVLSQILGCEWMPYSFRISPAGESLGKSLWGYFGALMPDRRSWKCIENPDPWRCLGKLWRGGYVPIFDGEAWNLHTKHGVSMRMRPDGGLI